jgi:hypothetical protein
MKYIWKKLWEREEEERKLMLWWENMNPYKEESSAPSC